MKTHIGRENNASLVALLSSRPTTLTVEHALECLPVWKIAPEWQAKHDVGELPEGIVGILGMLITHWPEKRLSDAEARWLLALREHASWRGLSSYVLEDSNQILGMELERAAQRALGLAEEQPE